MSVEITPFYNPFLKDAHSKVEVVSTPTLCCIFKNYYSNLI